jgi:hypothetical protein
MESASSPGRSCEYTPPVRRLVWAFIVFALILVPALDLASGEPVHDAARCPVHANPALAPVPAYTAVVLAASLAFLFDSPAALPLFGSSIFVPPRA